MTWTGRMFAKKVKRSSEASTSNDNAEEDSCPDCGHQLAKQEFFGFPAGVKFDPSDKQILEHLAAKSGVSAAMPHPYLDEFIPTLEGEDGICYTHPENLPGVKSDGSSSHFFHRPACAYGKGTRKRRRICTDGGEMRWHKTGKTRPVVENGERIGWKKIMVLYTNFTSSNRKAKPKKTNWVMHQYHCGEDEEEGDGELVVSKVFYQTQPRVPSNKLQRLATAAIGAAANGESDDGDDDPDSANGGFEETVPAPPRPVQSTPVRPCPTREATVVEVPQPSALNAGTPDSIHSAVNRPGEEGETLDLELLFCDENLPEEEQLNSQDIRDLATEVGLNLDDEDFGSLDIQAIEEFSSQEMREWF